MIFNLLLTFQKLNVEKRFVFQSLTNRALNILYNLWNSAESNLENAVNGISGVLDFKIFRGSMDPLEGRMPSAFDLHIKNPRSAPGSEYVKQLASDSMTLLTKVRNESAIDEEKCGVSIDNT